MAIQNPHQVYQSSKVNTASPGELTLMLYNGCLKFIKAAKLDMDANRIEGKNTNIQKAQNIVKELMVTLNMDVNLSGNLMSMYDFMMNRLVEANIKNNPALLDEVEELMIELRDTWKEVILLNRQKQYATSDRV